MFAKRMDLHVHYQAKWLIRSDNVKVKMKHLRRAITMI